MLIYHNPDCGTSRNTLSLLRQAGVEPRVVEYLKTPPSRTELIDLAARMGLSVRDVLRERGAPFHELGLFDPMLSDGRLLDAVESHPILINRPIVVSPKGVRLCRPSELALELLPELPQSDLRKEDGTPFLVDTRIEGGQELLEALRPEGLATDDLYGAGATFLRFNRLGGESVGYGGFESSGEDVLLRSVVVLPPHRGAGMGRNLALLLIRRAFDRGGRRAFALTSTAVPFFDRLGFAPITRAEAPAGILAMRQMAELRPGSATLLTRRITL